MRAAATLELRSSHARPNFALSFGFCARQTAKRKVRLVTGGEEGTEQLVDSRDFPFLLDIS